MSIEASARTRPVALAADYKQSNAAFDILRTLLEGSDAQLVVRLWNGRTARIGHGSPKFTLIVRSPGALRSIVLRASPLAFASAYFDDAIDFEGDLYAVLALKQHFISYSPSWRDKAELLWNALKLPAIDVSSNRRNAKRFSHDHTRKSDGDAIAFHYDVSNAFYAQWLDREMVYSCAYFKHADNSLTTAQQDKLDHICRKLRLRPGESMLDIGCGWGALAIWAARHYGVRVHGITLSRQQHEHAERRVRAERLEGMVTIELRDYRDLGGMRVYDKVSSVGMFEHVGLANLPAYVSIVSRVLKPGGLFLNHGITHDEEGWHRNVDTEFINRYVFPDGELDTVSNIQRGMERAGLEIRDVECLREHYAMTLRHWVRRLESAHDKALAHVNERTFRVWRLYMSACALEFERGGTGIYQILAVRRDPVRLHNLPLTRDDIYDYTAPDGQVNGRVRPFMATPLTEVNPTAEPRRARSERPPMQPKDEFAISLEQGASCAAIANHESPAYGAPRIDNPPFPKIHQSSKNSAASYRRDSA